MSEQINTQKKEIPKLVGQVDDAQIAAWKKSCTLGIYKVELPEDNPTHVVYLKNPTRHEVNEALGSTEYNKPLNGPRKLVDLTRLGGCEPDSLNDEMYVGLMREVKPKMNGSSARLVNL